ncbi:hypothetical protein VIGAN_04205400, partial [Vigna angularis var. angularis]
TPVFIFNALYFGLLAQARFHFLTSSTLLFTPTVFPLHLQNTTCDFLSPNKLCFFSLALKWFHRRIFTFKRHWSSVTIPLSLSSSSPKFFLPTPMVLSNTLSDSIKSHTQGHYFTFVLHPPLSLHKHFTKEQGQSHGTRSTLKQRNPITRDLLLPFSSPNDILSSPAIPTQ